MEEHNNKQHREEVCPSKKDKLNLETARAQIAGTKGPEYWRSLEELAGSAEFQEMMHREFGGFAGNGRNDGLHQAAAGADCSLCAAA